MIKSISEKIADFGNKKPGLTGQIFALMNAFCGPIGFYGANKMESLSAGNMLYFRGQASVLAGYIFLRSQNEIPVWPKKDIERYVILVRMCFSGVATLMRTYAAKINPLQTFIIVLRTEVIQTMIIGIIFQNKNFTWQKLIACSLSQVGVVMITYPEILFGSTIRGPDYDPTAHQVTVLGFCQAFFAGTISASSKLFVTENADKLRVPHVTMWVGMALIITGSTSGVASGLEFKLPAFNELGYLACYTIAGIFGQIFMFQALVTSKNAIYVTLYANFQVVIIFYVDYLLEGNDILFANWIGAIFAISAAIVYQFGRK